MLTWEQLKEELLKPITDIQNTLFINRAVNSGLVLVGQLYEQSGAPISEKLCDAKKTLSVLNDYLNARGLVPIRSRKERTWEYGDNGNIVYDNQNFPPFPILPRKVIPQSQLPFVDLDTIQHLGGLYHCYRDTKNRKYFEHLEGSIGDGNAYFARTISDEFLGYNNPYGFRTIAVVPQKPFFDYQETFAQFLEENRDNVISVCLKGGKGALVPSSTNIDLSTTMVSAAAPAVVAEDASPYVDAFIRAVTSDPALRAQVETVIRQVVESSHLKNDGGPT